MIELGATEISTSYEIQISKYRYRAELIAGSNDMRSDRFVYFAFSVYRLFVRVLVYSAEEVFSTLWYILEALTVVAFFTSCGLSIMYEIDTVPSVDLGRI